MLLVKWWQRIASGFHSLQAVMVTSSPFCAEAAAQVQLPRCCQIQLVYLVNRVSVHIVAVWVHCMHPTQPQRLDQRIFRAGWDEQLLTSWDWQGSAYHRRVVQTCRASSRIPAASRPFQDVKRSAHKGLAQRPVDPAAAAHAAIQLTQPVDKVRGRLGGRDLVLH